LTVYLITGASSGIGEQLSRLAVARGHTVYGVARRSDLLQTLRGALGERFIPFVCDVTDKQAVAALCASLPATPDVCICNAGYGVPDSTREFTLALHEHTFGVNYFGALAFVEALFPRMVERKRGVFVGISSLAAVRGLPKVIAYCASKAALSVAWEAMDITYRKRGLKFITVHPGFVETAMSQGNKRMPFLWKPEKAARHILNRVERGCSNITFPWPMRALMFLVGILPHGLYRRIVR